MLKIQNEAAKVENLSAEHQ